MKITLSLGLNVLFFGSLFMLNAMPLTTSKASGPVAARTIPQSDHDRQQIECIALNAYHEARNQGHHGIISTAIVVKNRVRESAWPNTPCRVVWQITTKKSKRTGRIIKVPQFTWTLDGRPDTPYEHWVYQEILFIAKEVYLGNIIMPKLKHATCYHADTIVVNGKRKKFRPRWASRVKYLTTVADHRYYDCTPRRLARG